MYEIFCFPDGRFFETDVVFFWYVGPWTCRTLWPRGQAAYKQRVRNVLTSKKAQQVAANCATSLKKTCKEVVQKKGAASRG